MHWAVGFHREAQTRIFGLFLDQLCGPSGKCFPLPASGRIYGVLHWRSDLAADLGCFFLYIREGIRRVYALPQAVVPEGAECPSAGSASAV